MFLGLIVGGGVAWWVASHTADGTFVTYLPDARTLALLALVVLLAGWLLATVAPAVTGGVALGAMPGFVYASVMLDRFDHERATSLLGTVVALTALGVGCAMQAYKMPPTKRHQRFPHRPPRVARR
jgi:hypothetical protein